MKKIYSIFALFCFLLLGAGEAFALNSYDKYGVKTGSYKKTTSGYNTYDKYGAKTGAYKKTTSGYISYDKYGVKKSSFKKQTQAITLTINTEEKLEALKKWEMEKWLNMINME